MKVYIKNSSRFVTAGRTGEEFVKINFAWESITCLIWKFQYTHTILYVEVFRTDRCEFNDPFSNLSFSNFSIRLSPVLSFFLRSPNVDLSQLTFSPTIQRPFSRWQSSLALPSPPPIRTPLIIFVHGVQGVTAHVVTFSFCHFLSSQLFPSTENILQSYFIRRYIFPGKKINFSDENAFVTLRFVPFIKNLVCITLYNIIHTLLHLKLMLFSKKFSLFLSTLSYCLLNVQYQFNCSLY